jgi:hypothetical protein
MRQASLPVALVVAVVVALGGCGSHPAMNDVPDLSSTTTGVPCAGSQCAPCADQFCDTADYGQTGTCRAHVAADNLSFGCDGPEDCGSQGAFGACCIIDGIGAACSIAGCPNNSRFMCHGVQDCAPGEQCCPLASGTTYSVCAQGC